MAADDRTGSLSGLTEREAKEFHGIFMTSFMVFTAIAVAPAIVCLMTCSSFELPPLNWRSVSRAGITRKSQDGEVESVVPLNRIPLPSSGLGSRGRGRPARAPRLCNSPPTMGTARHARPDGDRLG
mgnify:CR=1 FL=1